MNGVVRAFARRAKSLKDPKHAGTGPAFAIPA